MPLIASPRIPIFRPVRTRCTFATRTLPERGTGAAGLHALDVENVVDQADETVGVGDGDAQQILRLGIDIAHQPGGEQPKRPANTGEGGAELVRNSGDELVLDLVELGALDEE